MKSDLNCSDGVRLLHVFWTVVMDSDYYMCYKLSDGVKLLHVLQWLNQIITWND